jgi:nitrite reductase/ring-hydroxylating ferredoxin subunit
MTQKIENSTDDVWTVTAGKQDKEWNVEHVTDDDYIVYEDGERDDSNLVSLCEGHCDGTYFEYNQTCPHIDAARNVAEIQEEEEDDESDFLDDVDKQLDDVDKQIERIENGESDFLDDVDKQLDDVDKQIERIENGEDVWTVTAGKQDKEWNVEHVTGDDYIVYEDGERDDSNLVSLSNGNCDGTYFEYNQTCPHIDAARKVAELQEEEDDEYDYAYRDWLFDKLLERIENGEYFWTVTAGEKDKEWYVENVTGEEYIVYELGEKEDSNLVSLSEGHCDGTYFEYNKTCPHIDAARNVAEIQEEEKDEYYYSDWLLDNQLERMENGEDIDWESEPRIY